ncbi:hypothetical protein Mzhil_0123 [Methanosalsum zhilinae DSM 4017]|uniref:Uncharacterized protein n=1 Tax=Methanosalsum zhilinae (strain DSM 4017 / NBRC 107636 / OCM 62 / WeN5) TaxID=679901 RepID=F7XMY2_METZD|nr:hypothetical protein [Methanosalsum zhilinae]AEH60003.1 hypothetical protein Mzhil_0123 [Methanosalsum zhilinae DSM 4017]
MSYSIQERVVSKTEDELVFEFDFIKNNIIVLSVNDDPEHPDIMKFQRLLKVSIAYGMYDIFIKSVDDFCIPNLLFINGAM